MENSMTDEVEVVVDESTEIKNRLDMMGIKYHHNANLRTLKQLLEDAVAPTKVAAPASRDDIASEALKLIRCQITCMNPNKRDWTGENITTGNSIIGTVRKFVPYNCEAAESYHLPKIIVDVLRGRQFLQIRGIKSNSGATQNSYYVPEFQIAELPPLTKAELDALAQEQMLRNTGA